MSDVTAIQNLVQKSRELKKEISKIIVGIGFAALFAVAEN